MVAALLFYSKSGSLNFASTGVRIYDESLQVNEIKLMKFDKRT